eukprot:1105459-Amphidinium_carterae.1
MSPKSALEIQGFGESWNAPWAFDSLKIGSGSVNLQLCAGLRVHAASGAQLRFAVLWSTKTLPLTIRDRLIQGQEIPMARRGIQPLCDL